MTKNSATFTFMFLNNVYFDVYITHEKYNMCSQIYSKSIIIPVIKSISFQEKQQCVKKLSIIEKLNILDHEKKIKDEIYDIVYKSIDIINLSIVKLDNSIDNVFCDIKKQIDLHDISDFVLLNDVFNIIEDEEEFVIITSVVNENKIKLNKIFELLINNYCKTAMMIVGHNMNIL